MSVKLGPTNSLEVSPYHPTQVIDRKVQSFTGVGVLPLGEPVGGVAEANWACESAHL